MHFQTPSAVHVKEPKEAFANACVVMFMITTTGWFHYVALHAMQTFVTIYTVHLLEVGNLRNRPNFEHNKSFLSKCMHKQFVK